MTKRIDVEISRIERLVNKRMDLIANQRNERGLLYSGATITRQQEDVAKLLEKEFRKIIPYFSGHRDTQKIKKCALEQRDKVLNANRKLIEGGKSLKLNDAQFNARIDEVVGVLANAAAFNRENKWNESVKYLITTAIAVVALIVSVVA